MANFNFKSIPIYASGVYNANAPLTGYTCPQGKRSIIKNIIASNQTFGSGYFSVIWNDVNGRGVGGGGRYPILESGFLYPFGRTRVLDDWIVIESNEEILIETALETTGTFTISYAEIDSIPVPFTILPRTFFHEITTQGSFETIYTSPAGSKATVKSLTFINQQANSGYNTAEWIDLNQVGVGSTINSFGIINSGYIQPFGRLSSLDDIIVLNSGDSIRVMSDVLAGQVQCRISLIEEPSGVLPYSAP